MLLLLLLAQVAAVGVVLDNVLTQIIHTIHQQLQALLQVVAAQAQKGTYETWFEVATGAFYLFIFLQTSAFGTGELRAIVRLRCGWNRELVSRAGSLWALLDAVATCATVTPKQSQSDI